MKRNLNNLVKFKFNKIRRDYPIHSQNSFYFANKEFLDLKKCLPSERTWFGKEKTNVTRKKELISFTGKRYWCKPSLKNYYWSCRRFNFEYGPEKKANCFPRATKNENFYLGKNL